VNNIGLGKKTSLPEKEGTNSSTLMNINEGKRKKKNQTF